MAPATKIENAPTPETLTAESKPSQEQQIAELAYALWCERGCPEGSPELDWFEAEAQITRDK
jgi:hypothetical protein